MLAVLSSIHKNILCFAGHPPPSALLLFLLRFLRILLYFTVDAASTPFDAGT